MVDNDNEEEFEMTSDIEADIEEMLFRMGYTETEIDAIKASVIEAMQDPEYQAAAQAAGATGDVFLSITPDGKYKAHSITDPAVIDAMNELFYSYPPPTVH
jgi:hypothetical protein